MSTADRSGRHLKLRTDHAISQAYARLAADARARAIFDELLHHVRVRAPLLLRAPDHYGCHPGIEAVANLARIEYAHVRTVTSWAGCSGSWRCALYSLVHHLVSRYDVPVFLSAAWYAGDEYAAAKRRWFIAHASGASFRSLGLPIALTSRMEHVFLSSPNHFGIEYAMRRAELLGLGASPPLAAAVLAARPSLELNHGDFWRTVWQFLLANTGAIDLAQIAPIIDFVHAVRHELVAVDTGDGIVMRPPPQPDFSMKGRTARSLLRLMEEWHRSLGLTSGGLRWDPSPFRPLVLEFPAGDPLAPPISWELTELTTSAQLRAEGAALQHCVASYSYQCVRGLSRIWSLRRRRGANLRPVLTLEIDPCRWTIVQARGFRNRRASGRPLEIMRSWAAREKLRLAL